MGGLCQHSERVRGWLRLAVVVCGGGLLLLGAGPVQAADAVHSEAAWSAAVRARLRMERELPGTHTRAEYEAVLDGFRAIYHADPADRYAARAVKQVAEVLAEEGREFGDGGLLHAAAEQYEYLAHRYPSGRGDSSSAEALQQALLLLGPEWAADPTEAAAVRAELLRSYPESAAARAVAQMPAAASSQGVTAQAAVAPIVRVPARGWTPGAKVSATRADGSSLPAMPVTDGSAEFGAPVVQPAVAKPAVAKPAVVKPVVAKPARSRRSGVAAKERTAGEPAAAAAPTADGGTSLMRVLGLKVSRIVIDAGHGGHDSGTLGVGGIEEKDVVLDVALRLGHLLHERLGAQVVYTRDDDTFVPLEERTAIANRAQADLFISVHANSSADAGARGVEVYYLNFTSDTDAMKVAARENAVSTESAHELSDLVKKIALKDKIEESRELAADVDASLYAGLERGNPGLRDRGVKKAPFVVLIGAQMPSILAEISFVTNPQDAAELGTEAYRERVAESLYRGVAKYAEGLNGARGVGVERVAER